MFIHDAASAREWAADWIKYATARRSWGRTLRMLQDTIEAQRTCARSCRSRGQDAAAESHEAAVAELGLHVQHAQAAADAEAATQAAALRAAEAEREAMWARLAQKRAQGGSPRA